MSSNRIVLSKDLVIGSVISVTAALSVKAYSDRGDVDDLFMTLSLLAGFYLGVFVTIFFGGLRSFIRKDKKND